MPEWVLTRVRLGLHRRSPSAAVGCEFSWASQPCGQAKLQGEGDAHHAVVFDATNVFAGVPGFASGRAASAHDWVAYFGLNAASTRTDGRQERDKGLPDICGVRFRL